MLTLDHTGTQVSLIIKEGKNGKSLNVEVKDGRKHKIMIKGRSKINLFCPSVEGTVIWCTLKNGEEIFFDSITGNQLNEEALLERNPTFYQ